MKLRLTILLLLLTAGAYAQRMTGLLMSELTRIPLAYATISAGSVSVQTNSAGLFSISVSNTVDSVRINCAGFKYYAFKAVFKNKGDTLVIYLSPSSFSLREVTVRSSRNKKADSLRTRKEFANVFAYRGRSIGDVMTKVDAYKDIPDDHIHARNSTASLVGFDVIRLINFFAKKDQTTHLQKVLLQDEADNYVDRQFSKQRVAAATNLKGDSLQRFMIQYRPGISQLKMMNDYELIAYIKKCYEKFIRKGETVHAP